jgi:hypothetical protein
MRWPMRVLSAAMLMCCATAAVASGSGSGSGSVSGSGSASGSSAASLAEWKVKCRDVPMASLGLTDQQLLKNCESVCPLLAAPDLKTTCDAHHSFHPHVQMFREASEYRGNMQWTIFFICLTLLFGAVVRMSVPAWIPYTVFVMLFCGLIGALAHFQNVAPTCPHHVFHYAGADGKVSRSEWSEFLCEGCHPESYCLAKSPYGARTCGDGSVEVPGGPPVPGCRYTFEMLDAPWKQTSMVTEYIKSGAGDGLLSADELWRPECNLFRDLVGLSDIDPHVLLVVFLPPLLFESACFGIDYGIFRKQVRAWESARGRGRA